jgi:hypothetical protein
MRNVWLMSRYFFNLTCANYEIRDEEGIELLDIHDALPWITDAIEEAGNADLSSEREWQGWKLEVCDGEGQVALRLRLKNPDMKLSSVH